MTNPLSMISLFLLLFLGFNNATAKETVFRWASCGGGWRAMFADVGFANALNRAGVSFDNTDADASDVPTITGLSSTSGGSWFSTQFFYSLDFYEQTLVEDPDDLHAFVMLWMDSYLNLTETIVQNNSSVCSLGGPNDSRIFDNDDDKDGAPFPGEAMQWCILIRYYKGDWAAFMADMFLEASKAYETSNETVAFPLRNAGVEERHAALQQTDMIVQSSLSPMSRVSIGGSLRHVYLGDNNEEGEYFSTVLPTAYTVSSVTNSAEFHIGNWTFDELVTYVDVDGDHDVFSIEEYEGYNLYKGQDTSSGNTNPGRTLFTSDVPSAKGAPQSSGSFGIPFSSSSVPPKTGQIASISSAALGSISGLNPAELSQEMSKDLYAIETNDTLTLAETKKKEAAGAKALDWLYNADGLWGVSVCTQWPNDCGPNDSRFSDGAYTDNPAFPMNVAQYQRDYPDSIDSTTLKFVSINPNSVTPTNNYTKYNDAIYLGYFNTTFNIGIDPGEFIWAPGQPVPWPSTQIFEEFMDADNLHAKFEIVEGTNWTTAILKGTTIHNPVYGVSAGQSVEILYFMINSFIPTQLVGTQMIQEFSEPMADLARNIATNEDLQNKIKDFFFESEEEQEESSSSAPSQAEPEGDEEEKTIPPVSEQAEPEEEDESASLSSGAEPILSDGFLCFLLIVSFAGTALAAIAI